MSTPQNKQTKSNTAPSDMRTNR